MSHAAGFARTPEPPYYAVIFTSKRAADDGLAYGAMARAAGQLLTRGDYREDQAYVLPGCRRAAAGWSKR